MADYEEDVPFSPVPTWRLNAINASSIAADAGGYPTSPGQVPDIETMPTSSGQVRAMGAMPQSPGQVRGIAAVPAAAATAAMPVGGLGALSLDRFEKQLALEAQRRDAIRQAEMAAMDQRMAQYGQRGMSDLDRASMLFQAAGAFLSPTKTGSFGESLGAAGSAVAGPLSKAAQAEREREDKLMQLQLARSKMAAEMGTGGISSDDMLKLFQMQRQMAPQLSEKERLYQRWQAEENPQRKSALAKMLGIGKENGGELKTLQTPEGTSMSVIVEDGLVLDPFTRQPIDPAKIATTAATAQATDRQDQALELGVPVLQIDPYANLPIKEREKARTARYNADSRLLQKQAAEVPDAVLRNEIADLRRFVVLNNENRRTGYVYGKTPDITPSAQQMAEIESKLTIGAGKDLKGSASDRDVRMFGNAVPSRSKDFEANVNIAKFNEMKNRTELERREFMRDYLSVNKTLDGADRKWYQYLQANPFFKYPEKFDPNKLDIAKLQNNNERLSYQEYFRKELSDRPTPVVRDPQGRLKIKE